MNSDNTEVNSLPRFLAIPHLLHFPLIKIESKIKIQILNPLPARPTISQTDVRVVHAFKQDDRYIRCTQAQPSTAPTRHMHT